MKTGIILARFQPIHMGHIELIKKACAENDEVLIFIGSADKQNARNPIPWKVRMDLVNGAINECLPSTDNLKGIKIIPLPDLTDETDNSHDWGFYLFTNIVKYADGDQYTMYYSDGYEIITSWFPGFVLYNNLSLSLLARGGCHDGVSATLVRRAILNGEPLEELVPKCVTKQADLIKTFIEIYDTKFSG